MSVGLSGEDTATLGIDALRGIQVAQEEQPDLQFGETVFPLQLDTQDTACGTEGAATAEYFTADARVAGVLGPVCTAACLAAAPIYDAAGYSLVSPGCTSAAIPRANFTSFNHTLPGNAGQAIGIWQIQDGAFALIEEMVDPSMAEQ